MLAHSDSAKSNWFEATLESFYSRFDWSFNLEYLRRSSLSRPTQLIFTPGITAHVNQLAGDEIHLDANSFQQQTVTAAHEFGHILGFPDCYIEFYERENRQMIYYSLDDSNYMCALSGQFKDEHLIELRRSYFAQSEYSLGHSVD
jgi:hypothetical protein